MNSYFWLICGIWVGLIGAAFTRYRLKPAIASGAVTAREVASFTRGSALWIFIPCVALWLLQRAAGVEVPMYIKWPAPQRQLAMALQVFLWAALVFWVFVRNGAETLSKFARASSNFGALATPLGFKVGAIAVVVVGAASLLSALH